MPALTGLPLPRQDRRLIIGAIPTMQQLGFGLAVAIIIDITLVRGPLLPSTMALVGRWNWYLPAWTARALRVPRPSP
jgi:uncharacterized membrane protein YdfJ with MMPL/SSD domain